ncbi:hypothetical protein LX16_0366 [Stackebrandtia albiflava]|uniref:Deazaflavin-dependent oxidoreductase (Nitroreductase family) n=1 Tax=Stackebrandtia albiflava TaxID=406432 RepID=A0A562V9W5_9ACTN|nr:hypothetical protein [Stackebrandtia albiflava]TWJ14679.1 hypothetical protein LX16_0366 [Stackebrandtia albiflava]
MTEPVKVDPRRSRLRRMISLGNRPVRLLLKSPLHRPLSRRLMLLRYTGTKTGRRYEIPIGYHRWEGGRLLALSAGTRWPQRVRNLTVELRVAGAELPATVEVVEDRDGVAALLDAFVARHGPAAASRLLIGLPRDRRPTRDELHAAALRARLVLFTPVED